MAWNGFNEACAGIGGYTIEVRDEAAGVLIARTELDASNASWTLPTALLHRRGLLVHGGRYTVAVIAASGTGVTAEAPASFVVDQTAPQRAEVRVHWAGQPEARTSLALPWCVPPTTHEVRLSWQDPESATVLYYLGHVDKGDDATTPASSDEIGEWVRVGVAQTIVKASQGLSATASRHYAVRACNGVGLCTTSNVSRGVRRVDSPPVGGQVLLRGGQVGSDGFAGGLDLPLTGSWGGFTSGSAASTLAAEACIGSTPYGCQVRPFAPVDVEEGAWSFGGASAPGLLRCGATYHVSVRATNCAGLQRRTA